MSKKFISLIAALLSVGILVGGCTSETDNEQTENTMKTEITTTEETTAKKVEVPQKPARYLGSWQYTPPYKTPTDDRLAEAMPTPFDANIWPRQDILFEDFEDDEFDKLITYSSSDVFSDGCITLGDNDGSVSMIWTAEAGTDLSPGDYLVFTCRIKGENISGDGNYRSLLSIYDENGKWLNETHHFKQKKSTEWTEYQQILQVPEPPNVLEPTKSYEVRLVAYRSNISGTTYYDDFRLSKIIFDPMDTVLMSPAYKGIIKGEDGVGDISLRAYISDGNGLHDLSKFSLKAQITDEEHKVYLTSESDTVEPVMDIGFSSASLPMGGDYYLEAILLNKETGDIVQTQEWPLHKRPADFTTVVDYDEYNRVIVNGEPVLPISEFNHGSYDDCVESTINSGVVDQIMQSGYGWWMKFGDDINYQSIVQNLEDNGMRITLATGPMCFSNLYGGPAKDNVKTQSDIRGLLTTIVNAFRDLPNLFGYYIFDEQNGMRYGNELAWTRRIIESLDLDHPTVCAIDTPIPSRPGVYAKTSDFLGTDPYPVTGKDTQDISLVYDRIMQVRALNPGRPVYLIAQQFWYSGRGDLRGPTLEEFRNMYFQAICAGSCMFDNYAFREAHDKPSPDSTFEAEWANYTTVFGEVQKYEPIILSIEPAPYYEVEDGGEWFNHMTRRYDGKSYLFAVNNEMTEHTARVNLDGVETIVGQYSGKTYTADADGWFEIPFGKYEVEVFEFEQADYKSAHAELVRFTLDGMQIIDPTGESVIVANGAKSVEYNARISDYAQLYINGKAVENSGTLSLDGVDELTVKVVSEDGRFTTEKVYSVR